MKIFLIKFCFFVLIFFSNLNSADAVLQGWVPPDDYAEGNSYEMDMDFNPGSEGRNSQSEELSMEDIFGDEQVFPFPPGLGN